MGDPQESSQERKHEHVEAVESILDSVDPALEEHAYPVDREDLSAQYGETVIELPNETESLGSVFDRLEDDEYDSPMAAKEAVLREVSEATPEPTVAGADREPEPGGQGAPAAVREGLESDEVAEEARGAGAAEEVPTGSPDEEAVDVGTPAGTASEPAAEGPEPGDEPTPDTTETDEFGPAEPVEDDDREGDDRAAADRSAGDSGRWSDAAEDPGDPAEPTAEPVEAELDPGERAGSEEGPGVESGTGEGANAETRDAGGRDASGEPETDDSTAEDGGGSTAGDVDVDYEDVVDESAAEDESGDDVAEAGRDHEERGRR